MRSRGVARGATTRSWIVGIGKLAAAALKAASLLATDGLDVTVVDPRVVRPLDPAVIEGGASNARLVVTAEDG